MKFTTTLFALAALLLSATTLIAQDTEAKDTTAQVDAVMTKLVDAMGGREAHMKIKNRVTTGKMEIVGAGMEMTLKNTEAAPAFNHVLMEMTSMGLTQEQGADGKHAWSKDPMMGSRLLEGKELEDQLAETRFNAPLHWKSLYPKRSYKGLVDYQGKKCHQLEMELKSGTKSDWYVDAETHLHYGTKRKMKSPQMGEISIEMIFKNYTEVDGVKLPHRLEMNQAGQQMVITIEDVKHNVELAENAFELPADVKKLVEKKKAKEAAEKKTEAGSDAK